MNHLMSRRRFMAAATVAASSLADLGQLAAATSRSNSAISVFSKHLQWLDFDAMARTAAEIGFDGVDLTVRPGGHIEPDAAADELPRAVEAARKAGIAITMMTTAITDPDDPRTETILKTAAGLGIRNYRMGYYRYPKSGPIDATLDDARKKMRALAAMNKQFNIVGNYQNHAGDGYVAASIWDLWYVLKDLDCRWVGFQFDIRHAAVEGGNSWPVDVRRIAPMIKSIVAKDFLWSQSDGQWRTVNCSLGEGMVDFKAYLRLLKTLSVAVPVTMHLEYPIGGAEHGARTLSGSKKTVTDAMR